MKTLVTVLALVLFSSTALADKPILAGAAPTTRVSCELGVVAHDWDFSAGDQGFTANECDQQGVPVWQWGATSYVPGAPPNVWGTILNGDYPNDAGQGLRSPMWTVDQQSCLVEIHHYYDTEAVYDGGNLIVYPHGATRDPIGGYPVEQISPDPSYYPYCVDDEPGWSGSSGGWRIDCFDLSEFIDQTIAIELDFGSDASQTAPGWYVGCVRVGAPAPEAAVCCLPPTGDCIIAAHAACVEAGGIWHPEWLSCDPDPCPDPPAYEPVLEIGPWLHAEAWHNWVASDSIPLQLRLDRDPEDPITSVEFYWDSLGTWILLGTDDDGVEPWFDTIGEAAPLGDGWSLLAVTPLPIPQPAAQFKAVVHTASRAEFQLLGSCDVDPAPPSLGKVEMEDYGIIEDDTMGVWTLPNGTEIDSIVVWATRMGDVYEKGVPGINQQLLSPTHCAPTAAAQCLKYFEVVHGDHLVTGELDDIALAGALGVQMATNEGPEPGTYLSDWTAGLAEWIDDHGAGYTVRPYPHFNRSGWTWTAEDWERIRNELERSQDVLLGVFWQTISGYAGGHALTLNAIVNEPLPNGHIMVQVRDPWLGTAEWGELDPATGRIENLGGAGSGNPVRIGLTLIVCPAEADPGSGGPGMPIYHGANPYPDPVRVPLPEMGGWFIHVVIVNASGHAHRFTQVAVREPSAIPGPEDAPRALLALGPCTPNPFSQATTIAYAVPQQGRVRVEVYDVTGRGVRTLLDDDVAPGWHTLSWDGRNDRQQPVAAGIYYVSLASAQGDKRARIVVLR